MPTTLAVTAACALLGCSGTPTRAPPQEAVEGRVVAGGRPVPFVLVTFYPEDPADANSYDGAAGADGSFSVRCPRGAYAVTVNPLPVGAGRDPGAGGLAGADPRGPREVLARYRSRAQTPLRVDVPEGGKKGVALALP
jgi:hypothetical protein